MSTKTLTAEGFSFALARNGAKVAGSGDPEMWFFLKVGELKALRYALGIAESAEHDFAWEPFFFRIKKDEIQIGRTDAVCSEAHVAFKEADRFKLALDAVEARLKNDDQFRRARR